jgi:hypothetical protein
MINRSDGDVFIVGAGPADVGERSRGARPPRSAWPQNAHIECFALNMKPNYRDSPKDVK